MSLFDTIHALAGTHTGQDYTKPFADRLAGIAGQAANVLQGLQTFGEKSDTAIGAPAAAPTIDDHAPIPTAVPHKSLAETLLPSPETLTPEQKEIQRTVRPDSILNPIHDVLEDTRDKIDAVTGKTRYDKDKFETLNPEVVDVGTDGTQTSIAKPVPTTEHVAGVARGVPVTPQDLDILRNVLYSEVGNRSQDKRKLEASVVINTALNRVLASRARGADVTLSDVLTAKSQYQGYDPDNKRVIRNTKGRKTVSEYNLAANGEGNKKKLEAIDAVIDQLKKGDFSDNTNGAAYYIHNPDGTITYDDTRAY